MSDSSTTSAPHLHVVVLGWWGGNPKTVDRYSGLWENVLSTKLQRPKGSFTVHRNACSGLSRIPLDANEIEARLIESLSASSGETKDSEQKHDVVFHVMSNRGCWVYLALMRRSQRWSPRLRAKGVVFDSCPGDLHDPLLLFRALEVSEKKGSLMANVWKATPWAGLALAVLVWGWQRTTVTALVTLAGLRWATSAYHRLLTQWDPSRAPSLFLYSKGDELVLHATVERVAREREASRLMGSVRLVNMGESAHVAHLIGAPDVYTGAVERFAMQILALDVD